MLAKRVRTNNKNFGLEGQFLVPTFENKYDYVGDFNY